MARINKLQRTVHFLHFSYYVRRVTQQEVTLDDTFGVQSGKAAYGELQRSITVECFGVAEHRKKGGDG